jgi:hypothetical protein
MTGCTEPDEGELLLIGVSKGRRERDCRLLTVNITKMTDVTSRCQESRAKNVDCRVLTGDIDG